MASLHKWSRLMMISIFLLLQEYVSCIRIADNVHIYRDLLTTEIGGMAALHNSATNLGQSTQRCGAAVISNRHLLTTAHCAAAAAKTGEEALVSISIGRVNLEENTYPGRDTYGIQEVYIHPDYQPHRDSYNDIAILKTDRKVQFTDKIWAYTLPKINQVFTGLVEISGWGKVNQNHKSPVLRKAIVNVVENTQCDSNWRRLAPSIFDVLLQDSYPQGLTNQILCAGREGVDVCYGDSGGPLLHHDNNSDGPVTIIGIISRGIAGCPRYPQLPSFYTRVANYVDWIYDVTSLPRPQSRPPITAGPQSIDSMPSSQTTEEPSLCKLFNAGDCTRSSVAAECPLSCSQTEEPSLCKLFNIEDCTRSSVAAECPISCSQTEEPSLCKLFNAEACTRSSVAAECPLSCSQTEEPSLCKHFNAGDCTRSSVAAECPKTCSQTEEPSLCKHLNAKDCTRSRLAAECPQTCSQNVASTHPATSKPSQEVPNTTKETCGISKSFDERIATGSLDITEKIAGGEESIAGKYPWMIHLSFYSSELDDTVRCGGSLVSKRYVLTAAHCIRYLKRNIPVYVYIGYVNLKQREPQSELFSVYIEDISIHDEFSASTLKNDIALARLPQDLEYNALVQPVCIGGPTQIPFGGKAIAAGWGLISSTDTEIPDILREVELNVLPEKSCSNPSFFICTSTPNKDTCKGDSGGPLMVQQGGQWYIIGIVSHGPSNCGESNLPGVYTRISSFLPFIQSRI